jgi:Tfp pilus assembly protein PilF
MADHYLYLPMMSFGLLVALIVRSVAARSKQARRLAYSAVAVFAVVLALTTIARNKDWKNDFTLWQANYEAVPNSPRAAYNLGGMYLQRDPRRAEELFRQSLAADPNFEFTYQALARLLLSQKRGAEAEEIIHKGLELVDSNAGSYVSRNPPLMKSQLLTMLAATKWEAGDVQKAEQILEQAIRVYAPNPEPHTSLANIYRGKNRPKEIEALQRGLAANPSTYEMNARLASLLVEEKRYDEALAHAQRMAGLNPTQNDCKKGRPYFAAARAAAPRAMEWSALTQALEGLEQRCADL